MSRLRRQALLDAVDDGQLGGSLVGLGQQPLRLVEEAGVLEGDAEAEREGRQEPDVRLSENAFVAVDVLERDDGPSISPPEMSGANRTDLVSLALDNRVRDPALALPGLDVVDEEDLVACPMTTLPKPPIGRVAFGKRTPLLDRVRGS